MSKKNQLIDPKPKPFSNNILNTSMSATVTANFFLAPFKVSKKLRRSMIFTNFNDSNTSPKLKMDSESSSSNSSSKSFLSKKSKKNHTKTSDKITIHDLAMSKKVITREDIIEFNKKHGAFNQK